MRLAKKAEEGGIPLLFMLSLPSQSGREIGTIGEKREISDKMEKIFERIQIRSPLNGFESSGQIQFLSVDLP